MESSNCEVNEIRVLKSMKYVRWEATFPCFSGCRNEFSVVVSTRFRKIV